MSDAKVYDVPADVAARALVTDAQYQAMYKRSPEDSDGFWSEQADKFVTWFKRWDKVSDWDYTTAEIRCFEGARHNVSYNCLDRHVETRGDEVAILFDGDDPRVDRAITYRQLHEEVCRFANALRSCGVRKGDRVSVHMPMVPVATKLMPGSATRPFFGVEPEIVDADGKVQEGPCAGSLCIARPWPGQMRTVYGDHQRFIDTYFRTCPGKCLTGDGARRDEDGCFWITGRVDDVINVSGHRMGTAEVESALVLHESVADPAVVDDIIEHRANQ